MSGVGKEGCGDGTGVGRSCRSEMLIWEVTTMDEPLSGDGEAQGERNHA